MPALSDYTNVFATALQVLRDKGYRVWFDARAGNDCAEKDGWDFMSRSPCGLLGVVAIYEHVKPTQFREYWWRSYLAPDHRQLTRDSPDYIPVYARDKKSTETND